MLRGLMISRKITILWPSWIWGYVVGSHDFWTTFLPACPERFFTFFLSLMTFSIPASIFPVRSLNNLDSSSSEVRLSFRFSVSGATREKYTKTKLTSCLISFVTLSSEIILVPKTSSSVGTFDICFWTCTALEILNGKTRITLSLWSGGYVRKTKWNSIQTNFYF